MMARFQVAKNYPRTLCNKKTQPKESIGPYLGLIYLASIQRMMYWKKAARSPNKIAKTGLAIKGEELKIIIPPPKEQVITALNPYPPNDIKMPERVADDIDKTIFKMIGSYIIVVVFASFGSVKPVNESNAKRGNNTQYINNPTIAKVALQPFVVWLRFLFIGAYPLLIKIDSINPKNEPNRNILNPPASYYVLNRTNCLASQQRMVPNTDTQYAQSGPALPKILEKAIIQANAHLRASGNTAENFRLQEQVRQIEYD